ncbi:MAG TPA: serine hydrolase domain-containing protein, partial [Thermoanaerobaculia bacterium]|nr:serine hydrolase domain-containing protein [Thermoanaerobaculia bacterium]
MKTARTLFLLLFLASSALAQAPGEERALGWVRAFNSGSAEQMETFAQANFTAATLSRRDPAGRAALYQQMYERHGKLTLQTADARDGELIVRVKPERGPVMSLRFQLEPAAPNRIAALMIDIGGGDERKGPALPPLDLTKESLDDYLRKLNGFSGVVLTAKNGEVQFEKAYGLASRRYAAPNTATTRFNIGSITKDFTKVAIGQLAQAGKLKLDAPILTYLPNYPNKEIAQKVTVQQLIDHTSGLGDVFTPRYAKMNPNEFVTPQHFIDFFASEPLKFEPGKNEAYSNYGYVVLGAIVEALSGQSYFDSIQKQVFDAAGMSGSGFFDIRKPVPDVATGYTLRFGPEPLENTTMRPSLRGIPAGGSYSTARDLLLFERAVRGRKLLNEQWTRWILGGDMNAELTWAGGSPGVNAAVAGDGTSTVVVLTNQDPPMAERLAPMILQ